MEGLKDEFFQIRVNDKHKQQLEIVARHFGNGKKSAAVRYIVAAVAEALSEPANNPPQVVQNEQ